MADILHAILAALAFLFAWLVAPAGLVVSTLLLWQNAQKLREAHLKIRELEHNQREPILRLAPGRVRRYKPTIKSPI
jgi:hypothetical protein